MTLDPAARGAMCLVAASVGFAVAAVLARIATRDLPAAEVVVLRFAVGALGPIAWFAARRRGPHLDAWRLLTVRGLLGGLSVNAYYFAIGSIPVAAATLLNTTYAVFAAVFAAVGLGERLGARIAPALVGTTVGAALIVVGTSGPLDGFRLSLGAVMGVLSGITGGAAVAAARALRRREVDVASILLAFCLGSLLCAAPSAAASWVAPTPALVGLCALIGVSALVAQWMFTYAIRFLSAARSSTLNQLTPVITWVLAAAFLGESLRAVASAGAALVLLGVVWAAWTSLATERAQRPASGGAEPGAVPS